MRRARFSKPASLGRLALLAMLTACAGCANGSVTREGDLAADPAPREIAWSDPAASPPELGRSDVIGGASQSDRAIPIALAPSATTHLAPSGPFAIATCKKDAFCDDFEGPAPGTRWTSSVTTSGAIDFPGPSSSLGAHALRATASAGGAAYLARDGGAVGAQWVGVLELSLRVDALPASGFDGPELAVVDASGATTRIGVGARPEGLTLEQQFDSCAGSACTTRADLVSSEPKPGEWRRLVVAVETYGTTTPPFGRIEVIVDGGDLLVLPLTVTPFDGKVEARAGIVSGDSVPATARVDDVTFYAHAP